MITAKWAMHFNEKWVSSDDGVDFIESCMLAPVGHSRQKYGANEDDCLKIVLCR